MAELDFKSTHNICVNLDPSQKNCDDFREAMRFLDGSHLKFALTRDPVIYEDQIQEFWRNAAVSADGNEISSSIEGKSITITENVVRTELQLDDRCGIINLEEQMVKQLFGGMGYEGDFPKSMAKKGSVGLQWRYLMHVFIHCISNRKGGFDEMAHHLSCAFVTFCSSRLFNFSNFIFEAMKRNVTEPRFKFLLYPRFLQIIIDARVVDLSKTGNNLKLEHTTWKVFNNMKKKHNKSTFSGDVTPLFENMINLEYETNAQAEERRLLEQAQNADDVMDEGENNDDDDVPAEGQHVDEGHNEDDVADTDTDTDSEMDVNDVISATSPSSDSSGESALKLPTYIGKHPVILFSSSSSEETSKISPPAISPKDAPMNAVESPLREFSNIPEPEGSPFVVHLGSPEPAKDVTSPVKQHVLVKEHCQKENQDASDRTSEVEMLKAEVKDLKSTVKSQEIELSSLRNELSDQRSEISMIKKYIQDEYQLKRIEKTYDTPSDLDSDFDMDVEKGERNSDPKTGVSEKNDKSGDVATTSESVAVAVAVAVQTSSQILVVANKKIVEDDNQIELFNKVELSEKSFKVLIGDIDMSMRNIFYYNQRISNIVPVDVTIATPFQSVSQQQKQQTHVSQQQLSQLSVSLHNSITYSRKRKTLEVSNDKEVEKEAKRIVDKFDDSFNQAELIHRAKKKPTQAHTSSD